MKSKSSNTIKLFVFFTFILLTLISEYSAAQVLDKIIVKVDNEIIMKSELEMNYLQVLASQENVSDPAKLKCQVLETLIINKLLIAKAEIDSVTVEKAQVDEQLDRRMAYFISQIGSEEKLVAMYNKSIDDLKKELRSQVKEQLIIQKMQDNITKDLKVTPGEVKRFFNEIPKDSLPYFSTEAEIGQIVVIPKISKEKKNETREQLERIKAKILEGGDFCKMAGIFSEDPGSAKNCGELGFFKRGELVPEYEGAALKLKPGELSGIVESEYGFHLIQMIARRGNEFNTRHILIKPTSSSQDMTTAVMFLDSLRTAILNDSISFEKAAKKFSEDKSTNSTGGLFIDQETGSSHIPMEKLDPVTFFLVDTMKVGSITKPIPFNMEDGTEALKIVYYKSKTPPHQANLEDDYQKIQKATLAEKKNNAVNKWFDKNKGEVFIDIDEDFKDCELMITQ
ncbi:peptidyl-prolyl cis-trans isomerase [Sporocytophaga myxococcoides]|uniref:Peptidyl-prolyl cis-trans isomerase n=1 Tax=Sporocytophaga myxococcoides TaxID=153721 RepID=A0A098LK58_9BACT|nr:peptidylprolyl isomerase [Sporocytophaga myxococcoides]GAL87340.1 peptidyl-prolyl cis-trans isomerase [Sporocytophaga myxococcoides]